MSKAACLLSFIALALFASGCDAPMEPESKAVQPEQSNVVDLRDPRNLIPVFVASVSKPDDIFLHRVLLKTDAVYARANKFERQDIFPAKKARLLKAAASVKGKMVLLGLTGPLRAEDYDQASHSYSLSENHNFFYDQKAWGTNPPFEIRLVFDAYPKTLSASESVARTIASVNDGWDNAVLLTAANVVPQSCEAVNADWDGKVDLSQFCYLHVISVDAVIYVKSRQGGLVKAGTVIFSPVGKPVQASNNSK